MQTKITIRNEAQTCYIDIEGTIGVEQQASGSSGVATYEEFRREVERIKQVAAQNVVVNIRSTGGDVNDALLIYEALRSLDAHVTTRCYGYTASAATIIAQAADKGCREISSNAMYLIHRSQCSIEGNAQSLEARMELLQKTDERLAQLYAQHSGGDAAEYAALMAENNGEGRWLTAEETVALGLADVVIDSVAQSAEPQSEEAGVSKHEMPSAQAKQKSEIPKPVKRAVNTVVGELLRYIFSRLGARLGELFDGERDGGHKQRPKRKGQPQQEPATEEPAVEPSVDEVEAEPQPQTDSSATAGEVKAQMKGANHHSAVAFDEGQRRFKPTTLKAVEDPLMNPSSPHSNQQAYIDDAKAFCR